MRGRILAELRRRRDAWEPPPSIRDLGELIGLERTATLYHLQALRAEGLVHPDGIVITRKGYGPEN